jgi:hypothetical protein
MNGMIEIRPTRSGIGTTTLAARLAYVAATRGNEVEWYTPERDWDMIAAYTGSRLSYRRGHGYRIDPFTDLAYDGFSGDVHVEPIRGGFCDPADGRRDEKRIVWIMERDPIGFTQFIRPDLDAQTPRQAFRLVVMSDLEICHQRVDRAYSPQAIAVLRTGLGRMPDGGTCGPDGWEIPIFEIPADRAITDAAIAGRLMTDERLVDHPHTEIAGRILDLVAQRSLVR